MCFSEAYEGLSDFRERFRREKQAHHDEGAFEDSDYFPCWYCENHFNRVGWLERHPENPWYEIAWKTTAKRKEPMDD